MTNPARAFPLFRFRGSHREIGRQYGEACRDLIIRHRDLALDRLETRVGIAPAIALRETLRYRQFVIDHAPRFDDEVLGLAEGAGISLAESYLLQLRAELAVVPRQQVEAEPGDECTSFAILPGATKNGIGMIGQNADLPAFYAEIGVVVEFCFEDMPSILMLTPAGQISYIGINDAGLGVCANYLTCDGWRHGFPRYFTSRLALSKRSIDEAIESVCAVPRASSRNLLLLDSTGAVDLETTPTRDARLFPENGIIVHSNHYVAESLHVEERSPNHNLHNSRVRLRRLAELLRHFHGQLDREKMQDILQDRETYPDTLCRASGDDPTTDTITFASLISEPSLGKITLAVGPPHEHAYHEYRFS